MIKTGIEKDGNKSVLIGVFNSGYLIALLLFLAGSIGSLCDGVIASRGLGVAELAAIGIVYPYTKTMECISLLFSSGSQVIVGRKIGQNNSDSFENIGIKIVKSFAADIKYSFIYGVNFITITV
jgi:Na+-driven multidrug efflux pump